MSQNDFFIGWAETPKRDRRFFLAMGLTLLAGTGGLALTLATGQNRPGRGGWDMADVREFRGVATAEPYAMLRTADVDGSAKTVLLGCQGKCGVSARIGALSGQQVVIKGSLIQRGPHAMIAVVDGMDWIRPGDDTRPDAGLSFPAPASLGNVRLKGEILDSKCWFGAMRPSEGKVHKSCASLCIRGGIPPAFYVKDIRNQKALMILTDGGQGFGHDLLEFVADPVEISGMLTQQGNILSLSTSTGAIRRI